MGHRHRQRLAHEPGAVLRRGRRLPAAQRVELGQPGAIRVHGRAVPRRELVLGGRVEGEREARRVGEVLARDVAQPRHVHEAERDPAPEGGVRAGPGVRAGDDPGGDRPAVGHETPAATELAAHAVDAGHRLAVEPVGVQRARADRCRPPALVAEALQRPVARGDERGDRPRVAIAGEREQREGAERREERRARLRPRVAAEEARVVDEAAVGDLFGHGLRAGGREPLREFEPRPVASTTRSARSSSPASVRTPLTCGRPSTARQPHSWNVELRQPVIGKIICRRGGISPHRLQEADKEFPVSSANS